MAVRQRPDGTWVDDEGRPVSPPASAPAPAGAPRVTVTPSGATVIAPQPTSYREQDFTRTRQREVRTADEAIAEGRLLAETEDRAGVELERGEAKARAQDDKAAAAEEKERLQKQRNEELDAIQKRAQQEYTTKKADYDRIYSEARDAKIDDPKTRWAKAETGEKLLAGVGIFLGAIGSALTGGPNRGIATIEKALIAEREAQKEAIDLKWKKAEKAKNFAEDVNRQRDDEIKMADMAHAGRLEAAGDRLEAAAARTGRQEAIAEARNEAQKLRQQAAEIRLKNEQSLRERVIDTAVTKSRQVEGGAGGKPGEDLNLYGADGGVVGVAPDVPTARILRNKAGAYQKVRDLTNRLGGANPDASSEEKKQRDKDVEDLAVAMAIINNNEGKPSDADVRIAKEQVGTAFAMGARAWLAEKTGMKGLDPRVGWKKLGDRMAEKMEADVQSLLGPRRLPDAVQRLDRNAFGAGPQPPPPSATKPATPTAQAPPRPSAAPAGQSEGEIVTITKGEYKGRRARRKPNGRFELLD